MNESWLTAKTEKMVTAPSKRLFAMVSHLPAVLEAQPKV